MKWKKLRTGADVTTIKPQKCIPEKENCEPKRSKGIETLASAQETEPQKDMDDALERRLSEKMEQRLAEKMEEIKAGLLSPLRREKDRLERSLKDLESEKYAFGWATICSPSNSLHKDSNIKSNIEALLVEGELLRERGCHDEARLKFKKALEWVPSTQVAIYAKLNKLILDTDVKSLSENPGSELSNLKKETEQKILEILNHGSLKDLKRLKMIGEKRAQMIMAAREIGPFESVILL